MDPMELDRRIAGHNALLERSMAWLRRVHADSEVSPELFLACYDRVNYGTTKVRGIKPKFKQGRRLTEAEWAVLLRRGHVTQDRRITL